MMPKFFVDGVETATRSVRYEVVADNENDARNMRWLTHKELFGNEYEYEGLQI
jgi:hypothetical protein